MSKQLDFSLDPDGDGDDVVDAAIKAGEAFDVGGYTYTPNSDDLWRVTEPDTGKDFGGGLLTGDEVFNHIQHGRAY